MRAKNNSKKDMRKNPALKWAGKAVSVLLLLTAFLFSVSPKPAKADVIWTPEDTFYDNHSEDCEYNGRSYYANGPKGYITVWDSPAKKKVLDYIANGPIFFVYMSYDKGASGAWAQVEYLLDENGVPSNGYSWESETTVGWIPMKELTLVYDGISFAEDYASEIQDTDEAAAPEITMPESGTIYLWTYPGSTISSGELNELSGQLVIDKTYTDHNGTLWGHSTYYYGYRDFWINLTNPGDAAPTPWQDPPKLTPPALPETLESLPKTGSPGFALPITIAVLIILTILLTAAVIRIMTKKKNTPS